jgi:hypothetical protein
LLVPAPRLLAGKWPEAVSINQTLAMNRTILLIPALIVPFLATRALSGAELQPGLKAEIYAFENELEDFPALSADKKPTISRVDKDINVDAGDGSWPGTSLADHFFIRWTGKIRLAKDGKYTFFLNSDDGSRMYIDGNQVVDNGGLHSAEEKSGEADLKSGDHDLKIEFFENEGEAVCQFSWQAPGKEKEIVPAGVLFNGGAPTAVSTGGAHEAGLKAEIYGFDDGLEDFPAISADKKPTVSRVDKDINVDAGEGEWPGTSLSDHFFIRWTGKIHAAKDGKYTFFLNSDDGSRLYIDGKQIVDNGGLHGAEEKSGEADLKTGDHDLKIEFFENEGDAVCQFSWQAPGKEKEIVPASVLSH